MVQGMMPEAGTAAGARPRPEVAPSAYGGIEADRLVVLAKPLSSGAGYCTPFAVVRFQDLPEELRRQIVGANGSGHGAGTAARPRDPNAAVLRGEGGTRYQYHDAHSVDVVVPVGHGLRRQLPGLVSSGPNDERTAKFAGDGNSDAVVKECYERRRVLRLMEEQDGKVVVCLDASRLQELADMEGRLFQKEKGLSDAWMGRHSSDEVCAAQRAAHAYMGAVYDNGLPARENAAPVVVALLLDNDRIAGLRAFDSCSDGVASPREDVVPSVETLVGNGRATEQGIVNYYDVLLPPENVVPAAEVLPAPRPPPPTYAVQVCVHAAAGGKAGDPTDVKAVGTDAGHEHGGGRLSAVLGVVVASSAATALAAGTVGPATAFGLFTALVGGLSLAMASVRAP